MENEKVSERNRPYETTATAKRFSSTIKYTAGYRRSISGYALQIEKPKSAVISTIKSHFVNVFLPTNAACAAVYPDISPLYSTVAIT